MAQIVDDARQQRIFAGRYSHIGYFTAERRQRHSHHWFEIKEMAIKINRFMACFHNIEIFFLILNQRPNTYYMKTVQLIEGNANWN